MTARVGDESGFLQYIGGGRKRRAMNAEHLREKLVTQEKFVAPHAVVR